ncbi:MAG: MBL fold metallo-hydrolase [Pseudomonadota bacterium]
MKKLFWLLGGLVLLALLGAGYVAVQVRALDVERLSDDLYVLRGFGGNVAVLRTDAGTVIVDSMTFVMQGERIRDAARELTGQDVALIINTHYHLDHTHGNPAFAAGTRVVSTARTLSHLKVLDADFWSAEGGGLLPNETFSEQRRIEFGGKRLLLVHPGRGHTDGDLVVVFEDENVVAMGDLFFNRHYPNIDLEAGGSVAEWSETLDAAFELNFERIIPGHGETSDRAGMRQYQDFVAQLAALGAKAAADGTPLEDFVAGANLTADAGYEPIRFIVSLGLDRAFVLRRAWEEATGNFELANP